MGMAKTPIWKTLLFMDRMMTILVQLMKPCVKNSLPMSKQMNALSNLKSSTLSFWATTASVSVVKSTLTMRMISPNASVKGLKLDNRPLVAKSQKEKGMTSD